MLKYAAYVLVIVSLLTSPVIAGLDDLKSSADSATAVAKTFQENGNDSHGAAASDHHCCTAHVHYGNCSAADAHAPLLLMTNLRLPVLADQFLAAFGPNPLLEPPSRA